MWPFKRTEQIEDNALPEEVKEYYEGERREHIGVAWLLAFVTLIVTIAVLGGVFSGGRWAYRKYIDNDKGDKIAQTANNTESPVQSEENTEATNNTSEQTPESQTNTETPATPTPEPTPAPVTTPTPTPTKTSEPTKQDLADTGPGNVVAIFVGVTALSTAAHQIYSRRKNARQV